MSGGGTDMLLPDSCRQHRMPQLFHQSSVEKAICQQLIIPPPRTPRCPHSRPGKRSTHLSPRKKKVCPVGSHQTAVSMLS